MSLSGVDITEITNAMGVIPQTVGDTAAIIAPASTGAKNIAAAYARGSAVAADFVSGPLVELASYLIGKPAVCVRSDTTTAGGYGAVTLTGTGLSVPSADTSVEPYDEYEVYIEIVAGGTVGVAGITYKWSVDGGRTLSAVTALGTAASITLTAYNVKIALTANTLVAGDIIECRTTPPTESVGDLQDAEEALRASSLSWDFVVLATPVTSALFSELDTWLGTLHSVTKKYRAAIVNFRGPNEGETEADYLIAAAAFRAANTSPYIAVCYGYTKTLSKVSPGFQYRRPLAFAVARRAASIKRPSRTDLGQVAGVDGGPLPSDVKIRDSNGNPDEHDEAYSPGADDLQFITARTREGYSGVFIEKPWVFCATGSDIVLWQYRSLVNKVKRVVDIALTARLRSPVLCNATTGYILEEEALDIENAVDSAVRDLVGPGPDVSAHKFTLSRTDNLLSSTSPILNGEERIVPLAYPNNFGITIGFVNPARGQVA